MPKEGVELTATARQLNVGEDAVRRWYRIGRTIMAEDAVLI